MNVIRKFFGLLIYELIGNHFINSVPSSVFRSVFYRFILRVKCNKSVYFQMNIYIYSSQGVLSIGDNTIINRKCVLDRRGGLFIGKNVNLSPEVSIYTAGHVINNDFFDGYKSKVVIEDYVWIGTRAMVMPGVKIGKGSVVLPGSVVTKDIPPMSIVAGVPATKIGIRDCILNYKLNWRAFFM